MDRAAEHPLPYLPTPAALLSLPELAENFTIKCNESTAGRPERGARKNDG